MQTHLSTPRAALALFTLIGALLATGCDRRTDENLNTPGPDTTAPAAPPLPPPAEAPQPVPEPAPAPSMDSGTATVPSTGTLTSPTN